MSAFGVTLPTKGGIICHGGIQKPDSKIASKKVSILEWSGISNIGKSINPKVPQFGPETGLSHHAGCLLSGGDVLLIVGGWDGRKRTNRVYALDLAEQSWLPMKELLEKSGTNTPSGLTSHTVTSINDQLICVLGRQGGVRIQRRFAEIFYLHVDVPNGTYFYEHSTLQPASRSGHTTVLVKGIKKPLGAKSFTYGLFNFGGRDSGKAEMCGQFPSEDVQKINLLNDDDKRQKLKTAIVNSISGAKPISMGGLRFHAMLDLTPDCILVHGGRNFKAKPTDNVNGCLFACLVVDGKSNWFNIPLSEGYVPRFGHELIFCDHDLYVVGGFLSDQDKCIADTQKISVEEIGSK